MSGAGYAHAHHPGLLEQHVLECERVDERALHHHHHCYQLVGRITDALRGGPTPSHPVSPTCTAVLRPGTGCVPHFALAPAARGRHGAT